MNTAILAYSIAATVNQRLGLAFSREQEKKADECAVELMKFINVDPRSLSSALLKIKEFVVLSGNYHALSGEGTHPAIDERIGTIGNPTKSFNDPKYDQRISFVNSFNAILSFNNKNFEASANLIKRNIEAKVAVEEDYVLLAAVTMHMFDTPEKNQEALDLLTRAKTLNVFPTINLQKQEAIALIRLRRHEEAKKSLETYKDAVNNQLQLLNNSNGLAYNYYYDEFEWASKMIHKVTLL